MEPFASEVEQLRSMGFAEPLLFDPVDVGVDSSFRLESGRYGVAVCFFWNAPALRYSVLPLGDGQHTWLRFDSDHWCKVLSELRRHVPAYDDD